jgi:hypothetical protein
MYGVITPVGMGRVRVVTRGVWRHVERGLGSVRCGLGCGCGCGGGCSQQIPGVGQVVATTAPATTVPTYSVSNLGTDASTLLSDLYLNSDGSLNYVAVGLTVVVGALVFVNWGNTTKRRR